MQHFINEAPGDQMEKIEKEKKNMSGFSLSLIW